MTLRHILAAGSLLAALAFGGLAHPETITAANGSGPVACVSVTVSTGETRCAQAVVTIDSAGAATSAAAPVGAGTAAAAHRVTLASDDPAVASLSVLDDWDETDRAKVNLIPGQVGVTGGAGAVAASTPRITLASDDPGVTNLALVAASGSVLDDWDETDRAKVNLIAGQAGVTGGAGAVAANTVRVVVAGSDFVNVTTNTDTVVKASPGTFKGISVNSIGTSSSATVYNNTTCTGAKIGTYQTLVMSSLTFSINASVGICVTTAGAAAADITLIFE